MNTAKPQSNMDAPQTLKLSFNDINATLGVDGFLTGLVGRKITLTLTTTSVNNDTEIYAFFEGNTPLYSIALVYTDGSRSQMVSAERIV